MTSSSSTSPESPVAFVIADLDCGGTQRVVTTIANGWATRGRAVTVITFAATDRDFFALDARVRRLVVGGTGISRSPFAGLVANLHRIVQLRRIIKSLDAPVAVGFIAETNVLLVLASLGLGRRIVISERNDPRRQSFGPIWDCLRKSCYRLADVVTANSREVVEAMRAFVPERKLAYLPNPLTLPTQPHQVVGAHPTILCVGRLDPHKGLDLVIDAFALVNARYPAWRLSLVGEGPLLDQLTRRAQDRGVGQKVDFLGRVGDPYALYRRADVFVLASRYEGMPNAVLEAMSCGVPPVVSDCTAGALDYIEHETTGLIVPTDDSNALAAALGRLIDDRALRRRLGEAARERVSDLSFDRVAAIWDAMLYPKAIPASAQQGETASGSRNPVATRSP